MQSTYDYIIIGSGFGGSVSAMRLAEKGYSVLVIEKGKNYQAEDFPKSNWNIRKYFWAPFIKCFGFFKMNFFKDVVIVSGVGVGGGSIVYANTHVMPSDKFYTNKVWSSYNDWKETLLPFYNKAKFMLGTTKNKLFNREDEALREVAIEMDKLDSFDSVNVGVYFGDTENEKDPYFSGIGPKRKGCIECAGCMVGCQHNAKNTLDKNYLFFAKKFGTEILAETLAYKIEHNNDEYIIHTCSSKSWFKRNKRTFKSKGIIFSAGVLGTIDLLFKQKHKYKTLNNISDSLGFNLRTNSESLCAVTSKNEKLNHGIAISSVFEPDEHTHVEIVKYPDAVVAEKA
jgi:cholesterol oxidase